MLSNFLSFKCIFLPPGGDPTHDVHRSDLRPSVCWRTRGCQFLILLIHFSAARWWSDPWCTSLWPTTIVLLTDARPSISYPFNAFFCRQVVIRPMMYNFLSFKCLFLPPGGDPTHDVHRSDIWPSSCWRTRGCHILILLMLFSAARWWSDPWCTSLWPTTIVLLKDVRLSHSYPFNAFFWR